MVECARHGLETRRSISEEIVETRSCAVRRVLPCCSVSLAASSHAVDLALEGLSLPQFQPKLGWWRLLFNRLLSPLPPSPATPEPSGPLMRFRSLQRVKPRAATATQYRGFPLYLRPAGLSSPDSATPSGFLSLLTSCSARSPPSLVSCWWHSWVFAFEGFPSQVAVSLFSTQRPAPLPVHRCSTRRVSIFADTCPATSSEDSVAPTPVQGFRHPVSPLPRPVLPGTRDPCLPWR